MITLLIVLYFLISLWIGIVFKRLESRTSSRVTKLLIVWALAWPLWLTFVMYYLIKEFINECS
jgi:hypothetical protein